MTTISTVEQLIEARPDICEPAREWLADFTDLADAWDRRHRGPWLLWVCSALDLLDDRELRMIACKCVRETPLADGGKVWDLLTDERSRQAVTVAERYADAAAADAVRAYASDAAYATQADLIREIVGNPWRKEAGSVTL